MNTRKFFSILIVTLIPLTMIAATYRQAAGLSEGVYSRPGFELDLEDGHYLMRSYISYGLQPLEEGTFTVSGNQISFNAEEVTQAAQTGCGSSFTYTYAWIEEPDSNQVNLSPVSEPCQARQRDMARAPLAQSDFSSDSGQIPVTGRQSLPDGEYYRQGFELDLIQGRYLISTFISYGLQAVEGGNYTLSGNKITFTADTISEAVRSACGSSFTSTYTWIFDPFSSQVSLSPSSESCQARQNDLTRQPMAVRYP
ncbi:MAG TPA: hypothetical protein VMS73_00065 [Anaerolineaceae bacterium]|nr:hypothetical protein [Anaerolineaceae bacterium]